MDFAYKKQKSIKKQIDILRTPDFLNKIKEEAISLSWKSKNSRECSENKEEKDQGNKCAGFQANNYYDFKSSEIISSTKSQTFSEIEKQYNNLIEQALDISISNKDFSRMSSMRTTHLANIPGKFGSERTNTIFQHEMSGYNEQNKKRANDFKTRFKARISPILG